MNSSPNSERTRLARELHDGEGGVIDKENSFGLTGVSERLLLIGAKMKITSTPAGTSVSITL